MILTRQFVQNILEQAPKTVRHLFKLMVARAQEADSSGTCVDHKATFLSVCRLLELAFQAHVRTPPAEALRECLRRAEACVEQDPGSLYAVGIRPTYPATGYGYLLRGEKVGQTDGQPVFDVISFHEKPSMALAEAYFDAGDYFWNSGIFFGRTDAILAEIRRHQPELHEGLQQLLPDLDTERQASASKG